MKIKEFLEQFKSWEGEERQKIVPVFKLFSDVSKASFQEFMNEWDGRRSFEEFVTAQNDMIEMCLKCELSSVGASVRKMNGLEPLTEDTDIHEKN